MFPFILVLCVFLTASSTIYNTAKDIPDKAFKKKQEISAFVKKVIDGDTIRVHFGRNNNKKGSTKQPTVSIRLAGVDAPETTKNGKPGQPFSKAAKKFVKDNILNKRIKIKFLSKDQYGRVVASVKYKGRAATSKMQNLSEQLVRKGLATVYRKSGAQYDGMKKKWNSLEATAKKQKMGMWSRKNVQLPSAFKRQQTSYRKSTKVNEGSTNQHKKSLLQKFKQQQKSLGRTGKSPAVQSTKHHSAPSTRYSTARGSISSKTTQSHSHAHKQTARTAPSMAKTGAHRVGGHAVSKSSSHAGASRGHTRSHRGGGHSAGNNNRGGHSGNSRGGHSGGGGRRR